MLEDVIIRSPGKNEDSRGWLSEIFRSDDIPKSIMPQMGYISLTYPQIIRGPHEHLEQTDYFYFPGVSIFEIHLWDNNPESQTYKKNHTFKTLDGEPLILVVPPRVVHAYKNIGDIAGLVLNFPNKLYAGENKKEKVDEIRYENLNDLRFKIKC